MANEKNLKPFKKGDSRINKGGRPKTKWITDWINHQDRDEDRKKMLQKVMRLAKTGNMRAVEFIAGYSQGKPTSYLDMQIDNNPNKDKPIRVFDIDGFNADGNLIEEVEPDDVKADA